MKIEQLEMEESAASAEEITASVVEVGNNVQSIVNKTEEGLALTTNIIKRASDLKKETINSTENAKVIQSEVSSKLESSLEQLKSIQQINSISRYYFKYCRSNKPFSHKCDY